MKKPPSTKVMEIFSEAATTPAARRPGFLDHACEGDAELRAEIESLLHTHEEIGEFLDAPTVEGSESAASADPLDLLERDHVLVGRFAIFERVGEGGFGVVYRARQTHPIRREVALKILKLGMDTRQIIARFESERQALALMDHPNIARILDAGATSDGRPYFAMELVQGSPLTEYCDCHRLTIPQRLELFTAVCQAVQHAHQKGIIHRDLKPSNILVAESDGVPVPKVIDFGIAKAMEPRPGERTAFTELRHFIGTPQYMSPEQAGANNGNIDTRSDIYSLGVLLYELLTGVTPFDPHVLSRCSYEQVQRIVREDEPPRPSVRVTSLGGSAGQVTDQRRLDRQKLRRTVSGELDCIVMKAMEKEQHRRYETVSQLAEDVRRYLANEPLLAGPPHTLYRVRKFTRRHRKPLLVAAALTVALLLGLVGTTFGLIRAKHDRDRAQAAQAQAEQISNFLADMLRSADPDRAKGNKVLVRDVIERTSRSIDQDALKDQPLVEAGIRMALGGAYFSLGMYPESESHFRRALEIRRRILGAENRQTAQSMVALANSLDQAADHDGAETLLRQALAIQERTLGPRNTDMIATLHSLGMTLRAKGDISRSEATLRRAVDLGRKISPGGDATASALTSLAVTLLDERKFEQAESLFLEALTINRKLHGDLFRNVPRNLGNLAVIRRARGDLKGAEDYWLEALRLQRQMLPPDHPDIGWTLRQLAEVKSARGDLTAAKEYFGQSLDIERKVFGNQHPIVADILWEYSDVLEETGHITEGRAFAREAAHIRLVRETAALTAHPNVAQSYGNVAHTHLRLGQFRQALDDLNHATALDPSNHWYWFLKGCLQCYLGDENGYRAACRQMLDRFSATQRPEIEERAAKVCLLSAESPAHLDRVNLLADRAVASGGPYVAWFHLCKGMAQYRGGNYQAARDCFARASSLDDRWGTPSVRLLQAMTDFQLGNAPAARAAYRAVLAEVDKLPHPGTDDLGSEPENFLIFQVLSREARAMLDGQTATTRPSR